MDRTHLAFRIDIDTESGLREGVLPLLKLAREFGVRYTFFINMGRMWSLTRVVERLRRPEKRGLLPLTQKMGPLQLARDLALNPFVGRSHIEILAQAIEEGHEVGLHGGRNHGLWHAKASRWPRERLHNEVLWGLDSMSGARLPSPSAFASPGFEGSALVNEVLDDLGFRVVADTHAGDEARVWQAHGRLRSISTSMFGTDVGVGVIAHFLASGQSAPSASSQMAQNLRGMRAGVLYDHPLIAGREGLKLTRGCLQAASDVGAVWHTISELVSVIPSSAR